MKGGKFWEDGLLGRMLWDLNHGEIEATEVMEDGVMENFKNFRPSWFKKAVGRESVGQKTSVTSTSSVTIVSISSTTSTTKEDLA